MTIFRGPGGTGSATSDSDTTEFQEFLVQSQAARDAALAAQTAAELAEANAETAETNAETAETNAETAATNAASSASSATSSASSASSSASAASTSASSAASSASSASTSATAASSSASSASTSASNAATSATNAASSATAAASSATSASSSASTATTQASNASGSATAAASSASAASASATNASNSASSASTSATNAATSATAAAASATAAAASAASIDDVSLVHKSGAETITGTKTFNANQVISVTDNTNAALRITQTGTGNALLVEDSTSPDSTPFVIDSAGRVLSGTTSPLVTQIGGVSITPSNQVVGVDTNTASRLLYGASSNPVSSISKSNGTVAAPTTVVSGNIIGRNSYAGYDGTAFIEAARIQVEVDGTPGTNDMPGRLVFSTTADGASSPTERMRIDSAGQTKFSYNTVVEVTDNTNAALRITQLGTGNALLVEDSTNPDATPFVIDGSGRVIAGYTSSQTLAGAAYQFQMNSANPWAGVRWNAAGTGPTSLLAKSRSATIGTNSIVSSGDSVGALAFAGDDGTQFVQAASISAEVDGTPGTNDMPGRLVFSTTADGASSPTERVRINNSGAVGLAGANFGTSGQMLMSQGSAASPVWANVGIGFRNRIINGGFAINQRGYVSGAATTAGQYTLDRWKVTGTGGIAFSTAANKTTVTIPSGQTVQQVIEGLNLETGTYVLSWEGSAQGRIAGGAYGTSGTVTASITGGTNTTIEFNAGTVANVQLEAGSVATPFERRDYGRELMMCQRYFENNGSGWFTTSSNYGVQVYFRTTKRATPTISVSSGTVSGSNYIGTNSFRMDTQGPLDVTSWSASSEL